MIVSGRRTCEMLTQIVHWSEHLGAGRGSSRAGRMHPHEERHAQQQQVGKWWTKPSFSGLPVVECSQFDRVELCCAWRSVDHASRLPLPVDIPVSARTCVEKRGCHV